MIKDNLKKIKGSLPDGVELVVVSKFRTLDELKEVYETGQRDFAENRVQEMLAKFEAMPRDIRWHMIGHLQSNKVRHIAPFVSLIHSVDSRELAREINKQALQRNKIIPVLIQFHVAREESKFGIPLEEAIPFAKELIGFPNLRVSGVMGMATLTEDRLQIRNEFRQLKRCFEQLKMELFMEDEGFRTISMGMSSDYKIAVEEGSNLVRIGSKVFEN